MSTARARELRKQLTDAEKRLWSRLRRNQLGGHHFRRQRPIGPFIVDFVCMAKGLIVEVDGGQHADRAEEDVSRTAYLENKGYRVLRFWNNDVLANTEGVLEVIRAAVDER
jgi:very-short-patch-repair endonuclease